MFMEVAPHTLIGTPEGYKKIAALLVGERLEHNNTLPLFQPSTDSILLELGDYVKGKDGETFDVSSLDFAYLSGVYASSVRILRSGQVKVYTTNQNFKELYGHLVQLEPRFPQSYILGYNWYSELLSACYGDGDCYIPDEISTNVSDEWAEVFVDAALSSFMMRRCNHTAYYVPRTINYEYLNDLAHLMFRCSNNYCVSIVTTDTTAPSIYISNEPQDTYIVRGWEEMKPTEAWLIDVGEDIGIYLSGFCVK